jgi:hypothetical protein
MYYSLRVVPLGLVVFAAAASAAPLPAQQYVGKGTQNYHCETIQGAPAWQLLGPDAQIYDAAGKVVGRHFYGPRWQANDGSQIKGSALVANASPDGAKNAPWLVLRAVSEQGAGILTNVTTVTRTETKGGGWPDQACTASNQGATAKVQYSARYTFFSEAKATNTAE